METVTSDNGDGSTYTHQTTFPDREWEQLEPPKHTWLGFPVISISENGKTKQGRDTVAAVQMIIGSIIITLLVLLAVGLVALVAASLTLPLWR